MVCAVALLVLPCVLVACGGDGESDEEKIVGALEFALVSTDPDACKEQMTQAYLEQSFRVAGASALEACEQNARAEESPNEIGAVTNIEVDGSKATADVADVSSGGFGTTVALVEEDGDWKLNAVVGFVGFDRGKFLQEQREAMESGEYRPAPEEVDCILDAYRKLSRAEIEEIWLGGSAQPEIELEEDCETPPNG